MEVITVKWAWPALPWHKIKRKPLHKRGHSNKAQLVAYYCQTVILVLITAKARVRKIQRGSLEASGRAPVMQHLISQLTLVLQHLVCGSRDVPLHPLLQKLTLWMAAGCVPKTGTFPSYRIALDLTKPPAEDRQSLMLSSCKAEPASSNDGLSDFIAEVFLKRVHLL